LNVWRERTEEVSRVQLKPCANIVVFALFLSDAKLAVLLCHLLETGKRGYYIVSARQVQLEDGNIYRKTCRRVYATAARNKWLLVLFLQFWPAIDPRINPR
jgi:hypothetical protein